MGIWATADRPNVPLYAAMDPSDVSAVLVVRFLQPFQCFGIEVARRCEADLELHGFVNPGRRQTSYRFLTLKPKAEINAVLGRGLNPSECPARRDERNISLARLDDDFAEPRLGGHFLDAVLRRGFFFQDPESLHIVLENWVRDEFLILNHWHSFVHNPFFCIRKGATRFFIRYMINRVRIFRRSSIPHIRTQVSRIG